MSELTLTSTEIDILVALIKGGPLSHGYEPSKSARDSLIERGLAVSIVNKREDGWTAATLECREAYKAHFGTALDGKADSMLKAQAARLARRDIRSAGSAP